jgi:hypothetical protein
MMGLKDMRRCFIHRLIPLSETGCPACQTEAHMFRAAVRASGRARTKRRRVIAKVAGVPVWLDKQRSHWSDDEGAGDND